MYMCIITHFYSSTGQDPSKLSHIVSQGKFRELKTSDIVVPFPRASSSCCVSEEEASILPSGRIGDVWETSLDGTIRNASAIFWIGSLHRSRQKSATSHLDSLRARCSLSRKFSNLVVQSFFVEMSPHSTVHLKSTVAAETRKYEVSVLS